jgi:hypothetical protein
MPTKSHHTAGGFRNNYIDSVTKSLGDVLRWQWQRIRGGFDIALIAPRRGG